MKQLYIHFDTILWATVELNTCLWESLNKILFSLQNFKMFFLLVDFYNSMKYAKFQHRSPDKITKYTALYLEKWSFCWRQQFARITQKPRVYVSKSHTSCKNKLQSNKASRMVTEAY